MPEIPDAASLAEFDEELEAEPPPPPPDYYQRRGRRKRSVRATTVLEAHLARRHLPFYVVPMPRDPEQPRTRGECYRVERPCPYVSCRHHLYLDVDERRGSLKLNFPDLEPDELYESCSLDVADHGGTTLEIVGEMMNVTRERIRQLEAKIFRKLRHNAPKLLREIVRPG